MAACSAYAGDDTPANVPDCFHVGADWYLAKAPLQGLIIDLVRKVWGN